MTVPGESLHADVDGGWCLPPPAARDAAHTRSIVCRSFRRDDGLLDIDARFIDTRPVAYDRTSRGPCPPGSALHHLQVRLTVNRERCIHALVSAMPRQAEPVYIWRLGARVDTFHSYRSDGPVVRQPRAR